MIIRFSSAFRHNSLLACCLAILFASCGNESPQSADGKSPVVARVGDREITVREFRRSYESGLGHLKTGADRKRTYLNYMIQERLLALEGYRRGFHRVEWIRKSEQELLSELMVEALIHQQVRDKITVSEAEIREEINRSRVAFKFRFWTEPDADRARRVAEAMQSRGFAAVTDEILRDNPEFSIDPKLLETDYLNHRDVNPPVLNAIKDLPIGEISAPVEMNGVYYIFQVLDVRRDAVTETEYKSKAAQFEQVVFHEKMQTALVAYGTQLMNARQVVTRGESFRRLANALIEWRKENKQMDGDFPAAVQNADALHPRLRELREALDSPMMTSTDGDMSVREFLKMFRPQLIRTRREKLDFRSALHEAVGRTIRDHFLQTEARKLGVDRLPTVQSQLAVWRDKWVFEESRRQFVHDTALPEQAARDFFEANKAFFRVRETDQPRYEDHQREARMGVFWERSREALGKLSDSLQAAFVVEIDTAVLDTINVTDFRKSRWATVQIYRAGSNRPAFPIVDPQWASVRSALAADRQTARDSLGVPLPE